MFVATCILPFKTDKSDVTEEKLIYGFEQVHFIAKHDQDIKFISFFSIGQIVHIFDRFNDSAVYVGQVFLKSFLNSSLNFLN